jgi:hypothetical protein
MPRFIEKTRVAVRVWLPHEPPMDGTFAVRSQAVLHPGPETLLERLNAHDRVLPFHRERDAAVLLLNRLGVEWVEPGRGVPDTMVWPAAWHITREERVHVRVASGRELSGRILIELPEELNRASDFLNGADDFFALVTTDGVRLVNKSRVISTRVFEHSPRPVAYDAGETPGADAAV